jgi:hypothetical protein
LTAEFGVTDHYKMPILLVAGRRRTNRGIEDAGYQLLWDRVGAQPPLSAGGVDRLEQIDGGRSGIGHHRDLARWPD